MKRTVEVTEANFQREVLKSSRPVLVEFAPGWSFPAPALEEVLDGLATDFADYFKAVRVALDRSPNLGLWYGIRCIPTFLCFVDGEERIGIFGMTSKQAVVSQLESIINSRHMPGPALARFNQE
jgi:thioredoxin 1